MAQTFNKNFKAEKERDSAIMRTSKFHVQMEDSVAEIIDGANKEFIKLTNYFISELWFALGLDSSHIKRSMCRNYSFYPYQEFGIKLPETEYSGRLRINAYHKARGEVNKVTKKLRTILNRIAYFRKIKNMDKVREYQELMRREELDRSPPLLSENSPYITSTNMAKIIDLRKENEESEYDFKMDFGPIWDRKFAKKKMEKYGLRENHIYVSFNDHKHNRKLNEIGKRQGGMNISRDRIDFIYELPKIKNDKRALIGAIDQGHVVIITFVVQKENGELFIFQSGKTKQGKNAQEIAKKIARRKRGSKGRARAVQELVDYINWSCNELAKNFDLSQLSEIRLEDLRAYGKGENIGIFKNQFVPGKIREKLKQICHQYGVTLVNTPSWYKSRRCFKCGFTHKNNRKIQDKFICISCGNTDNADVNAAKNGTMNLFNIHDHVSEERKKNGFFWGKTIKDIDMISD